MMADPKQYLSHPLDFKQLAASYTPLKAYLVHGKEGSVSIDFKNSIALRFLTKAILSRDFGLSLSLPEGRLCPPIPNRLNYILWIQRVVEASSISRDDVPPKPVAGVDIGTGASCIYCLLGCRLNKSWVMVGTEVDDISIKLAEENVQANKMENQIALFLSNPRSPVFECMSTSFPDMTFEFTMCNPPFYSSLEDMQKSAEVKTLSPNAVCTGAEVEMIIEGGEVSFVSKMIHESVVLKTRCRWFTSMLGKLSSVIAIVEVLRNAKIENYAVTEFVQGYTRRWAIGWSFLDIRLPDDIARISKSSIPASMPPANSFSQSFLGSSIAVLDTSLSSVLDSLPSVEYTKQLSSSATATVDHVMEPELGHSNPSPYFILYTVRSHGDSWSRAARRRAKTQGQMKASSMGVNATTQLVCELKCNGATVGCRWLRGNDRQLFESFWSHVTHKLRDKLRNLSHTP